MNRSRVTLSVCDDGAGFDCSDARIRNKRLGLTSMQERADAIGASLAVISEPGSGTDVRVEVRLGE
jgi:signal transduction histidine kinase